MQADVMLYHYNHMIMNLIDLYYI